MAETTVDRPFQFSRLSLRTMYAAVREIATKPRRFRFRMTTLLLGITVLVGILAWLGHDDRMRAVMLESIQNRGGYVDTLEHERVGKIILPPDATMEEMQVLSRLFPKAYIMISPEPKNTP